MTEPADLPIFELQSVGIRARARAGDGAFVVMAGSQAREQAVESFERSGPPGYRQLRSELIADGRLVSSDTPGVLVFTQDVDFRKSTPAAVIILGRNADGTREWSRVLPGGARQTHGDWLATGEGAAASGGRGPLIMPVETDWPLFFMEMAERLLTFEDRQSELVQMLRDVGISIHNDDGEPLSVIDPFSFVSSIVKYQDPGKLTRFLTGIAGRLNVTAPVPTSFHGLPGSNPVNAWFFLYSQNRHPDDIPLLWSLARQAVAGQVEDDTFRRALGKVGIGLAKLTQGLYWLNPWAFLPLNSINNAYLESRGVRGSWKVKSVPEMEAVLDAARPLAPDFVSLSHAARVSVDEGRKVAELVDDAFPFSQYREDAARYADDRVKGNLALDRRYAPLLLELLDGSFTHLKPGRSPYSGREQLAVKVALGGGPKTEGGTFGRALMFADDSGFEYVTFPAGLTLEVGLPEGRGDAPRQALQDDGVRARLLSALLAPLPTMSPATLTLNTDFGSLKLLPLREAQREEVAATIATYAQGFGKSRRLRVGLTLTPEELESPAFPERLEAALAYLDDLTGLLDRLSRTPEPVQQAPALIEVPGQADEVPPNQFTPIPGVPLNQILYGPPGTGKTYRVVDEALSVLDPAFLKANPGAEGRAARKGRYDQLVEQGRVSFVTFHQSFGYEDFIEGIKPVMRAGQLSYQLHDGVFLNAVRAAGGPLAPVEDGSEVPAAPASVPGALRTDGQVWRIYIDGAAPVSQVRDRSLARSEIRMGSWLQASTFGASGISSGPNRPVDLNSLSEEQLSAQQHAFKNSMREGDVVLLATGQDRIGAVGVVTGGYRFDPSSDPVFALDYAHARPVRWLAKGLSLSAQEVTGKLFAQQTLQRVAGATPAQVLAHLDLREEAFTPSSAAMQPHVLIIDEINRGNVSKIFGELITLLEAGKRAGSSEALTATLPLSRRALSVPQSLYVIGTMNTADRSLTLLDAALRRRFVFRPVWPEPEVLPVIEIGGDALDLRKFLYVINERIERLLSREQVIGHAYLLGLPATLEGVASALRERILPLLEEYFFEDWSKIRTVLADDSKEEAQQFIQVHKAGGELRYRVNEAAFEDIEAFTLVYSNMKDADFPFRS